MKQYFGLLTAAMFLSVLPGTAWAQKDAGIPPMLETQRPLATPATQPEPRAPQADLAKPTSQAAPGEKTKKAQRKTCKSGKANLAAQKKATKTVKKKSTSAKRRSKVAASSS